MTSVSARAKGATVEQIRSLVHEHRRWAIVLLSFALLFKVLMPAGLMPVMTGKSITVELCSSYGSGSIQLHIPMDVPANGDVPLDQTDQSCSFAGLGLQALAATDFVLLEEALAFSFAAALLTADLRLPQHGVYLRPPLRGPPAVI